MDSNASLEVKYQNLTTEYSKLRANAMVLKKAVLEEQARSRDMKENLKEHEQKLRKSNQEMESLTFRNQQLTKRISVLQQELEVKNSGKKAKGKAETALQPPNVTLLDEELQKKIMDNAQLISAMADRDFEIMSLNERVEELQQRVLQEQRERSEASDKHRSEMRDVKSQCSRQLKESEARLASVASSGDGARQNGDLHSDRGSILSSEDGDLQSALASSKQQTLQLEQELERWKTECQLLGMKDGDEHLMIKEHFYQKIDRVVGEKQHFESLSDSLTAECNSLQVRLELSLQEKSDAERKLVSSEEVCGRLQEELNVTSHNYDQQLSTMSEHLADLNDKYAAQCELIQQLEYEMSGRSKKNK